MVSEIDPDLQLAEIVGVAYSPASAGLGDGERGGAIPELQQTLGVQQLLGRLGQPVLERGRPVRELPPEPLDVARAAQIGE